MKKWIGLFLCLLLIVTAAGCGNDSPAGRTDNQPVGVDDILKAGMAEEDGKNKTTDQGAKSAADYTENGRQSGINEDAPKPESISEAESTSNHTEGIGVDLTVLSGTMVYSEVYNMIVSPEAYVGKTVKMDGMFSMYHDDASDKYYFSCIIADATACCSQGLEFVLADGYAYPEDYPEEGGEICVVGVFDTYQEGDYTYCTLRDARIV